MAVNDTSGDSAADPPQEPRPEPQPMQDPAIEAVLRDLRELRLRMSSDLSLATAAVESDEPVIAADVLAADRAEFAEFLSASSQRLQVTGAPSVDSAEVTSITQARRWRRLVPLAPAVAILMASAGAAALVAAPHHSAGQPAITHGQATTSSSRQHSVPAVETSFDQFRTAVEANAPRTKVLATAHQLHVQIVELIAQASGNPKQLSQIAVWLHREQHLVDAVEPSGARRVLADSEHLARHLVDSATTLTSFPPVVTSLLPSVRLPQLASTPSDSASHSSAVPAKHSRQGGRTSAPASSPAPSPSGLTQPQPSSTPSAPPTKPVWKRHNKSGQKNPAHRHHHPLGLPTRPLGLLNLHRK